jgi:hypothetical protein
MIKVNFESLAVLSVICVIIAGGIWVSHPSDMSPGAPWFMLGLAVLCGVLAWVMKVRRR